MCVLRTALVVAVLPLATVACTTRTVGDPPVDTRLFVGMCVGATSAHAVGSHVDVALLDASGQPSRVVMLTVPGTARWQVEVGTYAVTVDGQRVATVTASPTAQESSGIGIGCPGPTTDAG